jgi:hypothetical protein
MKYPQERHLSQFGIYPHVEMCLTMWINVIHNEFDRILSEAIHMWIVDDGGGLTKLGPCCIMRRVCLKGRCPDETDLSTECTETEKEPRVSQTHGDKKWSSGSCSTPA